MVLILYNINNNFLRPFIIPALANSMCQTYIWYKDQVYIIIHTMYMTTRCYFLTVGELSSVKDLSISENATSFNISWTPPFSLDVTDEVFGPSMWYSVLIYNVTDETNTVEIHHTDCINITQTYYIFTPDYFTYCHKYQFSILPINGAGQGKTSSITYFNGMQSNNIFGILK